MERFAINKLIKWKNKSLRKPLIIRGARQVGKTWLMKEFAKREYKKVAYVNFESSKALQSLFIQDYDIQRILTALNIATGVAIEPENTLIIFDEIQEANGAITSLKYFCENAPEYHIIAAGSLLGVTLHQHTSFPVGKVEFIDLHPLSFSEFLMVCGEESLFELLKTKDWTLISTFKAKYINLLKEYYFVGGMPEVVRQFISNRDFKEIRTLQKEILLSYNQDFSKHAPTAIVPRIRMLWNSIPTQLSKENKKYIYGLVKEGSRAKDYELALSWLIDCGLVYQVYRVSKPGIPLISYRDLSAFKLFIVDIGLLTAMSDIEAKTLLEGNRIFEEFKGALTEQYVLQQLVENNEIVINYWASDTSKSEIDFLIQHNGEIIPIGVKAQENLQAKNLRVYCNKFTPPKAIRTSMSDYRVEHWLVNIPLYAIGVSFD